MTWQPETCNKKVPTSNHIFVNVTVDLKLGTSLERRGPSQSNPAFTSPFIHYALRKLWLWY